MIVPFTATVSTDDGAYSMHFEYDNDGVYPIRREHLGLFVRELPYDVEEELVGRAYSYRRDRWADA